MRNAMNHRHAPHHPSVKKQVTGVLDEAKRRMTLFRHDAAAKGHELAGMARERGSDMMEEAQSTGEFAWKKTKSWIGREPGRAIGAAFILGAIVSAFLRRDKD